MMEERDNLRKQDPASPRLLTRKDEITNATSDCKRRQHRPQTDRTMVWRTIKGIDGKQTEKNEGISFIWRHPTSPKLIASSFNRQFSTSNQRKYSSSRRRSHVSNDVKRMSLEEAESFTNDYATSTIKSCRNSRTCCPYSLSIFHLMNLGPLATEHLTTLYTYSLQSCRLPSIWKTSLVIPIPKSDKDSLQGTHLSSMPSGQGPRGAHPTLYQRISQDQHGFRTRHSTTSAPLQLITDYETGFNQREPLFAQCVWSSTL